MTVHACNLAWGPLQGWTSPRTAVTYHDMDGAAKSIAHRFPVPKAGIINKVYVGISDAITGNPPAVSISLQTLDANGKPSGTLYGGCLAESYDFTTTGLHTITLATPATVPLADVTAGTWVAILLAAQAGFDASNKIRFVYGRLVSSMPAMSISGLRYTTLWLDNMPPFGIGYGYSTGEVYGYPIVGEYPAASIDKDNSPDEIGARFNMPFDCVCDGALMSCGGFSATYPDFDACLYNSTGTLLASRSWVKAQLANGPTSATESHWASPVTLSRGAQYYLTHKATLSGGTHVTWPYALDMGSDTLRANYKEIPLVSDWETVERTDGGAWSAVPGKAYFGALLLSSITVP